MDIRNFFGTGKITLPKSSKTSSSKQSNPTTNSAGTTRVESANGRSIIPTKLKKQTENKNDEKKEKRTNETHDSSAEEVHFKEIKRQKSKTTMMEKMNKITSNDHHDDDNNENISNKIHSKDTNVSLKVSKATAATTTTTSTTTTTVTTASTTGMNKKKTKTGKVSPAKRKRRDVIESSDDEEISQFVAPKRNKKEEIKPSYVISDDESDDDDEDPIPKTMRTTNSSDMRRRKKQRPLPSSPERENTIKDAFTRVLPKMSNMSKTTDKKMGDGRCEKKQINAFEFFGSTPVHRSEHFVRDKMKSGGDDGDDDDDGGLDEEEDADDAPSKSLVEKLSRKMKRSAAFKSMVVVGDRTPEVKIPHSSPAKKSKNDNSADDNNNNINNNNNKHNNNDNDGSSNIIINNKMKKESVKNNNNNNNDDDEENDDYKTPKKQAKNLDESLSKSEDRRRSSYLAFKNREPPRALGTKEIPEGADNCMEGLVFVLTGVYESIDRDQVKSLIERYGGKVTTNVSRNTKYLVVGRDAGASKLSKASELGTKQIDEDGLLNLIRTLPGKKSKYEVLAEKEAKMSASKNKSSCKSSDPIRSSSSSSKQSTTTTTMKMSAPATATTTSTSITAITFTATTTTTTATTTAATTSVATTEKTPKKAKLNSFIMALSATTTTGTTNNNSNNNNNNKTEPNSTKNKDNAKDNSNADNTTNIATINDITVNNKNNNTTSNDNNNATNNNTNNDINHLMWVDKYKPTSLKQIIGQQGDKSQAKKLYTWLVNWHKNAAKKPIYGRSNDDGVGLKAALLSGPPGIGKTTTAQVVCQEAGFTYFELNASDTRSKRSLKEEVSEALNNHTLAGFFGKSSSSSSSSIGSCALDGRKHCLLMDEVDGMAGNEDRGGVQELIQLMKSTRIPIVCMCNDRNHPKIRSLANHCFDLRFPRPRVEQIKGTMMSIAYKEGLKIPPHSLNDIISSSNHDIRQILHNLSMWTVRDRSLTYEQLKLDASRAQKDMHFSPFDVCRKVFSGGEETSKMTLMDKSDLFFHDYNIAPLFVQENYLHVTPFKAQGSVRKQLMLMSKTADSLSMGDLVDGFIRKQQHWSLLPVQAMFSSVLPGEYMRGGIGQMIQFPSWLGKNSTTNKNDRLLQELTLHTSLSVSGNKNSFNMDYLPSLKYLLTHPLLSSSEDVGNNVERVVNIMNDYNLLREDFDNINELCGWSTVGNPFTLIDSKVKSSFTRMFNKQNHLTPYSSGQFKRSRKKGSDDGDDYDLNGDEDGGGGGDDGGEKVGDGDDDDDDDLNADSMIKVKKPTKSRQTDASDAGKKKPQKAKKTSK